MLAAASQYSRRHPLQRRQRRSQRIFQLDQLCRITLNMLHKLDSNPVIDRSRESMSSRSAKAIWRRVCGGLVHCVTGGKNSLWLLALGRADALYSHQFDRVSKIRYDSLYTLARTQMPAHMTPIVGKCAHNMEASWVHRVCWRLTQPLVVVQEVLDRKTDLAGNRPAKCDDTCLFGCR